MYMRTYMYYVSIWKYAYAYVLITFSTMNEASRHHAISRSIS
jgi:hypothetical protein